MISQTKSSALTICLTVIIGMAPAGIRTLAQQTVLVPLYSGQPAGYYLRDAVRGAVLDLDDHGVIRSDLASRFNRPAASPPRPPAPAPSNEGANEPAPAPPPAPGETANEQAAPTPPPATERPLPPAGPGETANEQPPALGRGVTRRVESRHLS